MFNGIFVVESVSACSPK